MDNNAMKQIGHCGSQRIDSEIRHSEEMIGVVKKKVCFWLVGALMVALLMVFPPAIGADAGPDGERISWESVELEEVSDEVAAWAQANYQKRGVYVLPAGEVRYLLVAWGEKPTGGYSVQVDGVERDMFGGVRMAVQLTAPGPDEMVTEAITYPHQLIALDAGDNTITVNFIGELWSEELGEPADDDPEMILRVEAQPGQPAPNPLVVWGRARVYEATFQLVVEDGHYHLSEDVITVAEGGPSSAEFAVVVTMDSYTSPHGTVVASVEDAADGGMREVAAIPISFGVASRPFEDVLRHWAEAFIRRGIAAGFIHGYPDGRFLPERTVTRAEFLKMLVVADAGADFAVDTRVEIPFDDVAGHWVEDYVRWALVSDWLPEDGLQLTGSFGPDEKISRQEMAALSALAAGLQPLSEAPAFEDAGDIESPFVGWVAAAVDDGLIVGYPDDTFRPGAGLRRSESVVVIWRFVSSIADRDISPDVSFIFTFDEDAEGWTGDFTDLPADYDEEMYALEFAYSVLPEELDKDSGSLMLTGSNRSDDLFMYVKRQLTAADGIEPDTLYRIYFEVEFATDAPAGAVGVGGPPGEAVWVKVGAAGEEPVPVEVVEADVNYLVLNVDKGRQNEDGDNAVRIGDVAKVTCEEFGVYEMKTLDNTDHPLHISSDADGNLWVFVGTDSGFEGTTTLYYHRIEVHLEKVG